VRLYNYSRLTHSSQPYRHHSDKQHNVDSRAQYKAVRKNLKLQDLLVYVTQSDKISLIAQICIFLLDLLC